MTYAQEVTDLLLTNWSSAHKLHMKLTPQWVAADAEIKVPFGENTELKRSPFKAWSRSVNSMIRLEVILRG